MSSHQSVELQSFRRFIFGSIDALIASIEGLNEPHLNWRPSVENANSLYAIAMHVLGNAEENILRTLCGLRVKRHRDSEFAAKGASAAEVRQKWEDLKKRIDLAFAELPDGALNSDRSHPRRGMLTGRDILIVVARHAAEHWGEAQLTLSLLKADRR